MSDEKEISKSVFERKILNIFGKYKNKKLTIMSRKYWEFRGFESNKEIDEFISTGQRKRSKLSVDYWTQRGYSRKEAEEMRSSIQQNFGKQSCKNSPKSEGFQTYKNAV